MANAIYSRRKYIFLYEHKLSHHILNMPIFLFLVWQNFGYRLYLYFQDYQSYSFHILFCNVCLNDLDLYMGTCHNVNNT